GSQFEIGAYPDRAHGGNRCQQARTVSIPARNGLVETPVPQICRRFRRPYESRTRPRQNFLPLARSFQLKTISATRPIVAVASPRDAATPAVESRGGSPDSWTKPPLRPSSGRI